MGVAQSVASLARAVGPALAAFLIYSAIAFRGFDGHNHHMSDVSILRTFWTAAAIQFLGFFIAVYFARKYGRERSVSEVPEAA
jgi:hypothetical protein